MKLNCTINLKRESVFRVFFLFILLLGGNYAKAQCSANTINAGNIIPNTFYQTVTQIDNEYRTFNATAGCTYTFTFCEGGGSVGYDSQLEIYDNGGGFVAYNDDSYCGLPSHLVWTCTTTGVYRIQHKTYYCNSYGNSATIAYITTCAPTPPCSVIPNAGTATATTTTFNCSGFPQLNLTGGSSPTGNLTFNWESSPTGAAPWTPVPGGSNLSTPAFNVSTPITATTYYRVVSTCASVGSNQSTPVQITVVPASAPVVTSPVNINCGDPASLTAQAVIGGYINWFPTAVGGTPLATGNTVSVSPTTNTTYYAEKFFPVTGISTTGGAVVDHNSQTGDDRSGIAVSANYVYVVGDNNTGRFNKMDLTGGISLPRRDGIFSDVISQRLYSLSNGSTPHDNNLGGTINAIVELDENLAPIGTPISLSQSFTFGSYIYGGSNIIAPGYGFMIFYTGGTIYRINLSSGVVTNMGAASLTVPYAETWSTWGWSEYDGTDYHLYYLTNNNNVIKRNLTTGAETTVQTFTNMSDMACMTYNMATNRFYFHYEGSGQFGGTSETVGYVGAVSSNNCGYGVRTPVVVNVTPPTVTVSTTPATVCLGEPATTTFTGTPNSTVTYNVNGGSDQTLTLDGTGNFSITGNPTATTTYNLVSVVSGACSGAMTGSSSVTVNPRPNGSLTNNTLSVCKDQPASIGYSLMSLTPLPITVNYTDGTNNYTETITANGQIISVPSNVAGTFNFSITSITNQFNCAGIAPTDYSTAPNATVLVNDRPTATVTSAAPGVCPGDNTDVTITFTGTAPFFFEYSDGVTPISPTPEMTNTYTFNVAPTTTTTYFMTNLSDGSFCVALPADIAVTATVEAWDPTAIITQPLNPNACHGTATSLSVGATGSNLTYQWFLGATPLTNTPPYSGADAATLNISSVNGLNNGQYTVVVNGSCGGPLTSDLVDFTENFNNTWTGTVSNDWSNTSNWACGILPTQVTNAVIPDMPNDPIVDIPTAICKDLLIDANATVTFTGANNILSVYGDIVNSGTLDGTGGTGGTVALAGTAQNVTGPITLENLQVTGGGVKTLNTDVTVDGILDLDNGNIQLGTANLTLSQPTAQTGGGPSSFIVTNGTGKVTGNNMGAVGGNPGAVAFHVGINNTSYTPVTLENLGDADNFSVRVMENVYEDGTGVIPAEVDNPVVDRTWLVEEGTAGGSYVTMTPSWNSPGDEVNGFDQTHVYVAHHMGGEWTRYVDSAEVAPAADPGMFAGMLQTTQDSIMSFSPFTVASNGQFPLSIHLSSIVATNVGPRNKVQWTSAKEDAGDMYELESSADGRKFTRIATVAAKGEASSYLQWDEQPVQGVNYYRVKLLNNDGTYSYSKVVTATVKGKDGFSIEAYPNPVKNMVSVKVDGVVAGNAKVVVTDVTGKVVKAATAVMNNGAEINVSDLAAGVYLLNYSDDNRNESIKITKQ